MKPPEQCKGTAVYKLLHFWRLTVIESTSFPRELPCCRHTFSQICMCLCRDVNSKRSFWNTPHERFCITWPHFMLFQTTYYPTHTDLFTVCLHRHYISTMRIWFYLLCSLLHPEHQEPCLACGRHWIKIWMNECAEYAGKDAQMGVPLTHPAFYFLIISAHLLPAFRQGKRCISIFLSVFQMQATLTSVLFQLAYKNKYPARNCVQNSRRCQNKFIPFNISRVTANPRWPSGSLLPKCIITVLKSTLTRSSWAHHINGI